MRFPTMRYVRIDQQMLRPACAYAKSDQSLCLSLEYYMNIKLLNEHNLEFLSLKEGYTGSSESIHVKMSHCWKHMSRLICRSIRSHKDELRIFKIFLKVSHRINVDKNRWKQSF